MPTTKRVEQKVPRESNLWTDRLAELAQQLGSLRKTSIIPLFMHKAGIDRRKVSQIYGSLKRAKNQLENLDVILHSPGGDADAAYHLGKIFQNCCKGTLTFIVPRYAKSAATMLACSGNVIIMTQAAELGPVDPQIDSPLGFFSVRSLKASLEFWKELLDQKTFEGLINRIPVLAVGDMQQSPDTVKEYIEELLQARMLTNQPEKAREIANKLVEGYKAHARCIPIDLARKIGLNVKEPSPKEEDLIWKMFEVYEENVILKEED